MRTWFAGAEERCHHFPPCLSTVRGVSPDTGEMLKTPLWYAGRIVTVKVIHFPLYGPVEVGLSDCAGKADRVYRSEMCRPRVQVVDDGLD